jgi:hypothetical protein
MTPLRYLHAAAIVLALAACGGGSTPTPGNGAPPPTPTATATTAPDSTLVVQFGSNLSGSARSTVIAFPSATPFATTLPASCPATCSVSLAVTPGSNQFFHVTTYAAPSPAGTPLQFATANGSFISHQTTVITPQLQGVMATFSLAVTTPNLVSQFATAIRISAIAKDVTGATIAPPYVSATGGVPQISVSEKNTAGAVSAVGTIDVTGNSASVAFTYTGIAPNPASFTGSASGYPTASTDVTFAAPTGTVGYAVDDAQDPLLNLNEADSRTTARRYFIAAAANGTVRFDPSGTIWFTAGTSPEGITTNGNLVGPLALSNVMLLGFDVHGDLYVATDSNNPVVNVYSLGTTNQPTLIRSVAIPTNPCAAAADAAGNLYVAGCFENSGVYEFASGVSGNTPTASNPNAFGSVAVDGAGNVYVTYEGSIGVWSAGTFGAGVPARTIAIAGPRTNDVTDLAVDAHGDAYVVVNGTPASISVGYLCLPS